MLNIFKKKERVGGYIKYYGIEDFWLNNLTSKEHDEVKKRWSQGLGTNPEQIDKGNFKSVGYSKSNFLIVMAQGISDIKIKDQLLQWSLKEQTPDVIDTHFNYMNISDEYKKMIKLDKSFYSKQIEVLEKDCQLFEEFCNAYIKLSYYKKEEGIPSYPSFRELAIAYERTGKFQEAIDISELAIKKRVKENTSFDRRIEKLKKKVK
ncbi:hypothetical protein [Psychrobacillus sp. FSL H8-0510]|uniref:hypothetical protein n=1 Tax=Psychrobacillus sp. FSL H8-0510 TaxID=2921394 RepID=UPI0030FC3624